MHQKIEHKACLPSARRGGGKRQGFTLIELLVVIAIIGLLSTLAVVALNNARSKGRDAKRVADIKTIQTALELYFADSNGYPDGKTATETLGQAGALTLSKTAGFADAVVGTTYMGKVPANPTPGGAAYTYKTDAVAGTIYTIGFTLEEATGSLATGANCAQPSGITSGACPVI